jgi:hypothetical protein
MVGMMTKKRILFSGCSHTANSGFSEENIKKFHWPWLLSDHFDCYFYNSAIGGSSNDEIFYRTLELVSQYSFDLVVVMWTSIGRKWEYFSDDNVDDFTILNGGVTLGFNKDDPNIQQYSKIYYSLLNNEYMDTKRWIDQTLALGAILKETNTKFVFIKGCENRVTDILNSGYTEFGFDISDDLKSILDFNNRPDYYINEKLKELKLLTHRANQPYWFNFSDPAFISKTYCLDFSDDGEHLGKLSNQKLTSRLIPFCEAMMR